MSGYTKLFGSILDSTVWELPHATVRVWVTLLAMADRHGEVQASVPGLAHRARVTLEESETALAAFLSPDKYSRTPDQEGRRIEPIDGGWRLVNHEKYTRLMSEEDRKAKAAARQRKYVSNRQQASVGVSKRQNDYTQTETQTQIETETKTTDRKKPGTLASLGEQVYEPEFELIWVGTGRRGSKELAHKAWGKRGRPSWESLLPVHSAYMLSERPVAGFVKDLSGWFNGGFHLRNWEPARKNGAQRDVSKGWAPPSAGPYPKGEQEI